MSADIERLVLRVAEGEDRRAPPVTVTEVKNRIDELTTPIEGMELVVGPILPEPARHPLRRSVLVGAVAVAVIAVARIGAVTATRRHGLKVGVTNSPTTATGLVPARLGPATRAARAQQFVALLA